MKNELKKLFSLPEELIIEKVEDKSKQRLIEVYCRIKKRKILCLYCKSKVSGYDHVKTRLRHTVIDGKTVYLNMSKKRFYCKKCQRVFTDQLTGLDKNYSSDHFIQLVQEKARNNDYSSVARETGISSPTVSRMIDLLNTNKIHLPKKRESA